LIFVKFKIKNKDWLSEYKILSLQLKPKLGRMRPADLDIAALGLGAIIKKLTTEMG